MIRATSTVVAAALALLAGAPPGAALPLYASRQGATCVTCHVDPNGGGIRNEFGFTYLKNRHSIEPEERWANMTVDPKLNDWITLGLDVRVLYYARHVDGRSGFDDAEFIPMQGQVNLAVAPHEHLTLVATHGLLLDAGSALLPYIAREIYGMVEGLPGETYARIGRFRLPFGLRQDDHTSFTRGGILTYDAQKPSAGLEIGKIWARWFIQGAVVNDNEDRAQRLAAKIGHASRSFQAGLSGFHDVNANDRDDNLWSFYASATRGRLTLIGEYVGGTVNRPVDPNRVAFFAEADVRVRRGVNLRAKMDYEDLLRDTTGGLSRRFRIEADINPVPFMETKLSIRQSEPETGENYQEYLVLVYFPF